MSFLSDHCSFSPFDESTLSECDAFNCGHKDLNDFFLNDAMDWHNALLGKTYCFKLEKNPKQIVCAFTVSNDSIKKNLLPRSRAKKISQRFPRQKRINSFPAVLIGRLGVNKNFRFIEGEENTSGDQLMMFIKAWFRSRKNKTGCRFVVVDSYNEEKALAYYRRNEFDFLFTTEEDEKKFTGVKLDRDLKTRLMFFDLKLIKS